MQDATVLTEDAVVEAVCRALVEYGYTIDSRASAIQHGYDIVASKDGERLIIEVKGAGSSKAGTARFGKTFTSGQVFDHAAKAVLKALRVVSAGEARAAVALPADTNHQREMQLVAPAITRAGIGVFWVSASGDVKVDVPWDL
jgi:Domain of unknown function (DUF3883)